MEASTNKSAQQAQHVAIQSRRINGASVQTADARELHAFLEVGKDFSTWIKSRIDQYGFVENQDFVSIPQNGGKPSGGRPTIDYFITLDMAKELAMVERNDKGKQARQYFIECERRAKAAPAIDPMQVLSDPAAMRGLLLTYTEKVLALEATVEEQRPKVEAFELISVSDGDFTITQGAKMLNLQPQRRLFNFLNEESWIYKANGRGPWLPHAKRIQQGLMVLGVHPITHSDGRIEQEPQARITAKGLQKLSLMFSGRDGHLRLPTNGLNGSEARQ